MPLSYFQLLNQALNDIGDPEMLTISEDFQRQLCEVCLCLLSSHSQPTTVTVELDFPFDNLPGVVDFIPVIDLYEQIPLPQILLPLVVRDFNGRELSKGSVDSINYFEDSWYGVADSATEYYILASNLIGIRRATQDIFPTNLTYVPYTEIISMQDIFAFDDSYQDRFVALLRLMLFLRLSNFKAAERELERFAND